MTSSHTDAADLQKGITGAYFSLRLGMGVLAAQVSSKVVS
jgi:hypothetical protein